MKMKSSMLLMATSLVLTLSQQGVFADHQEDIERLFNVKADRMSLRMFETPMESKKRGNPPLQLFAGKRLEKGDRIVLDSVSGTAIYRSHPAEPAVLKHLCPINWRMNFKNLAGQTLPLFDSQERVEQWTNVGIEIPEDDVRVFFGFNDTDYQDNEGIRPLAPKFHGESTNGCQFQFRIVSRPILENYSNMKANIVMLGKSDPSCRTCVPAQEIFIGKIRGGARIRLAEVSGNSVFRIENSGRIPTTPPDDRPGFSACPKNWKLQFVMNNGGVESIDLEQSLGQPIPVPFGAQRAFVGFSDSVYNDNEGGGRPIKGASTQLSTNGCRFVFALRR